MQVAFFLLRYDEQLKYSLLHRSATAKIYIFCPQSAQYTKPEKILIFSHRCRAAFGLSYPLNGIESILVYDQASCVFSKIAHSFSVSLFSFYSCKTSFSSESLSYVRDKLDWQVSCFYTLCSPNFGEFRFLRSDRKSDSAFL